MEDFDLLVPPDRATAAMVALRAIGATSSVANAEAWVHLRHSVPFTHPDGWELDLHWYSLWRSASDQALDHAIPVLIGGEQTLAPGPTHQLLLVCVPRRRLGNEPMAARGGRRHRRDLGRGRGLGPTVEEANERLLLVVLGSMLDGPA